MPVPVPTVTAAEAVEQARQAYLFHARHLDVEVEEAVEALVETGAIPAERWRFLAHILYCRAIYATHVQPLESRMSFEEIANHLNTIGIPRFRGASAWSGPSITDIRAVVADSSNQILLPDP
jgi:hypothetical protein